MLPGANFSFNKLNIKNSYNQMIRAARQGDKEARYWLSRLYYNGEGVAKNRGKADCWNKKAVAQIILLQKTK